MSIFITGGAGFIGSQFVREWVKRFPDQVLLNFDKLTYAGNLDNLASVAQSPGYVFIQGDICDREAVRAAIPDNCDAVVHFAAESHVDRSIHSASEFIQTNVLGTQVLLDVAREKNVRRFLHISTDEVGGSMGENEFFAEDGPFAPNSPYAASKAAAEHLVRAAHHTFGMNTVVTRTSNNYGPFQFPEKLLPLAISNALEEKPIPVYGDGLQVRDWIHVADNCEALLAVLESGKPGETYHIGGRNPLPNRQVLSLLLDILGKPETLLTQVTDRLGHDRRYAVDCSKIERELGWKPRTGFREGLTETIQWYRDNPVWVERAKTGEYRNFYQKHYGAKAVE
jgi:dTDP-glucose 4,6-dehydratase